MTKTERDALVRIVKSRFEILHEQLQQRRAEIEELIRDRMLEEVSEVGVRTAKAVAMLDTEAEKLRQKAITLREKARTEGIELTNRYGSKTTVLAVEVNGATAGEWRPLNFDERVGREVRRLYNEAGIRALTLREQEQQLIERVYTEALESEEAKELFEEIPTIDSLLPLPSNGGELTAGAK